MPLPASVPATGQAELAVQQHQLELATLYERLHDWERAEAQLLAAANGPSGELRERARAGIERVRGQARGSIDSSSLKLGRFYEGQGMWSEAEEHYLDTVKEGSEAAQVVALERLKSVRDKTPRSRVVEEVNQRFDILSGLLSRGLALVGFLAVLVLTIRSVLRIRRRIEVLPFLASSDLAGAQIKYWLGHAQAMVQTAGVQPRHLAGTNVTSVLPYLQLPELVEELPEFGEIAVAGFKVSARELLQGLARARVRISGGWIGGAVVGKAFARLELRRRSRYVSYATIRRDIPATQQDQELELFAYQVWIKAAEIYGS